MGLNSNQDALFNMAAINLLIGGILAILFSAGILNKNIVLGIGIVCIIASVFFMWESYNSVKRSQKHQIDYDASEALMRYSLTQIRDVQRAYKSKKGNYAPDFAALKEFFVNDKIQKIEQLGSVPSRKLTVEERDALYDDKRALDQNMTEREAALLAALGNPANAEDLSGFKRDTLQVFYKNEFLSSRSRKRDREQLGLGAFNIEDLKFIPMTDPKEEWTMETRKNVPYLKNDTISTIHVYGKEAVSRFEDGKRGEVGFGDLNTSSDKGTWE